MLLIKLVRLRRALEGATPRSTHSRPPAETGEIGRQGNGYAQEMARIPGKVRKLVKVQPAARIERARRMPGTEAVMAPEMASAPAEKSDWGVTSGNRGTLHSLIV
jgi:hypothetical protein